MTDPDADSQANQVKQSFDVIADTMRAVGMEVTRLAIESGELEVEKLEEPKTLNFGKFDTKTTYKYGCKPGLRLAASAEEGGVDEILIGIKKADGGVQVIEIGRNPKTEGEKEFPVYGDPESDYTLVIHDDNGGDPTSYYVSRADINRHARVGEPFVFGSEKHLGEIFQGGEIEKVVGFSRSN